MVNNPPANAGDTGSIPDPERKDPTCCGITKLVHHNYGACALDSVLRNKKSQLNEKPLHCN